MPGSGWQTSSNYDIPAITYNKSGNIITLKRRNQSGTLSDDATYYLQSGKNRIQYILDNGGGGGIDNVWYDHDANGNLTFIENFDSGQLHELTYDPSNRLIRVQELGYSEVTDYRISASGWRYWSKAGTANAIYSPRDGSSPLGEFSVGSFPFTWTLRRPDGSVYGRKGYSSNKEFFWTDPLGSVRVRTSNSGSMLEAHDYYPFGLDMPGRSSAGLPMRQGFTGYWRDGESGLGLYYSGARMYSPGTGRFFGVDPLAEQFATWSPFVYTFNNPVNWRDPDGRSACCGTLQGSLRFAMTKDQTYLGTLARADSRGQLNSQIRTDAINVSVAALDKGIYYADAVSTGAAVVAAGSVMLSGPTGGASLAALPPAMAVNFGASLTGIGLSVSKEYMVGSSFQHSATRGAVFLGGEVITRTFGSKAGALFSPLVGVMTSESNEQNQGRERSVAPADNTQVRNRPEEDF